MAALTIAWAAADYSLRIADDSLPSSPSDEAIF